MPSVGSKFKLWLELVRFSHTIFALPFAVATMFLAAEGWPKPIFWLWIIVCMVTARNGAMAFNRLVDRKIDAENSRTKSRHLPAGLVSPQSVIVFILLNSALFTFSAWQLNSLAGALAIPTLVVLFAYSLFKRFSWLCHLFLGLALGLSPIATWVAMRNEFHLFPILLGGVLLFWVSGFDVLYATADLDSDKKAGLHSIPVRFGVKGAKVWAASLHLLMLILLTLMERTYLPGNFFSIAVIATILLVVFLHIRSGKNSLDKVNSDFFLANGAISVLLMVGLALAVFVEGFKLS